MCSVKSTTMGGVGVKCQDVCPSQLPLMRDRFGFPCGMGSVTNALLL